MIVLPTEAFQDSVEHPQVRRLYLTDVGYFPRAAHHYRERKEGIEEYIFFYCMEGSGILQINGQKDITLHEKEALCIPRYRGHRYFAREDDPWSILWVHFKGDDTALYPLEDCQVIHFASDHATDRMMFLFEQLFRVLEGNYTLGNFIYISQVLYLILAETYYREKPHSTQVQNKLVTNVVRYMYKHLDSNLTLEALAREFDLSKSYLCAIFQEYTQHSPMDFYIRLKMKEACKLLRQSNTYIYEVGQRLGYSDPYYFSRIFKKIIGVSPKEYKSSIYI